MPFEKGQSGNPAGRPKGSKNRSTAEMREALASLVDSNIDKLDGWLDEIAKDDPKAAFDCVMKLAEYNLSKCSRTLMIEKEQSKSPTKTLSLQDDPIYNELLDAIMREEEREEALQ